MMDALIAALFGILIGCAILAAVVLGGPSPVPVYNSAIEAEAMRRLPPWETGRKGVPQ